MSLKTDYKDAIFPGNRKYQMIQNEDSTVSFQDVTEYTQEGDSFGATDINMTNMLVNSSLQVISFDPDTGVLVTTSGSALQDGNGEEY